MVKKTHGFSYKKFERNKLKGRTPSNIENFLEFKQTTGLIYGYILLKNSHKE